MPTLSIATHTTKSALPAPASTSGAPDGRRAETATNPESPTPNNAPLPAMMSFRAPGELQACRKILTRVPISDDGTPGLEIEDHVQRLNAREASCRTVLGELAAAFCRQKAQHRLAFSRLGDYTRERLGLSARELESLAQVATALRRLPTIAASFARGELSWTRTRLLATVATSGDEEAWIARARTYSGAQLAALVRHTALDAAGNREAGAEAARRSEAAGRQLVETAIEEALDRPEGEVPVQFRLRCPPRIRGLFFDTVELARRVAGEPLPLAHAAEAIAAEALSGAPRLAVARAVADPACPTTRILHSAPAQDGSRRETIDQLPPEPEFSRDILGQLPHQPELSRDLIGPSPLQPELSRGGLALAASAAAQSPFELDTRLRAAVQELRSIDWDLGRTLESIRRQRLHRVLGFRSLADYVRDRLSIAPRTARALMAAERVASACTPLGDAYRTGDLSWLQVLTLAPVAMGAPEPVAAAWVARAGRVTLRRLTDEVGWHLARRDAGVPVPPGPPPLDARLQNHDEERVATHAGRETPVGPETDAQWQIGADGDRERDVAAPLNSEQQFGADGDAGRHVTAPLDGERQIGARDQRERLDAQIAFTAPASIVAIFRAALGAFASAANEPGWRSCQRMLEHVCATWKALPRHRDPIFERDGWRCAVPACSGRRQLHDHHVRFRSRGGDNRRTNRITVCAWHHLRAVHRGLVRGWGTAPGGLRWQLGIDTSSWALLDFLGDRYLDTEEVLADRRAHKREIAARFATWIPTG